MGSIDNRIVKMTFDNKDFMSKIDATTSALGKLTKSLDVSNSANQTISTLKAINEISLSSIATSVTDLTERFTGMGLVGMQTMMRLTNAMLDMAVNAGKKVTGTIFGKGKQRAFNIENAHFMLQGLIDDETEVQAVMKDANDSVNGTAYAYDEAAKAAAQFAASGLTSGKEMQSALRAIAGTAATANAEYEDISRIFTTVAGNGRLYTEQLLQLSSRGLNAAASIAKVMGVTEQEVRDMTTKGEISFAQFAKAMDEAFGEHAKAANETFNGVMSNIRAALGRIGADFFSPLIVQNGALVQMLNTVRQKINDIHSRITKGIAKEVTDDIINFVEIANKKISKFNVSTTVVRPIVSALHSIYTYGKMLLETFGYIKDAFSKALDIVNTRLRLTSYYIESMDGPLKMVIDRIKSAITMIGIYLRSNTNGVLDNLVNTFQGIISIFKIIGIVVSSVIGGILDFISLFNINGFSIVKKTGDMGIEITRFAEKVLRNSKQIREDVTSVLKDIYDNVTNLFGKLKEIGNKIYTFFKPAIDTVIGLLAKLWESFEAKYHENVLDQMAEGMDNVAGKMKPFTKAWELVKSAIGLVVDLVKSIIQTVSPMVEQIFGKLGTYIADLIEPIRKSLAAGDFSEFLSLIKGLMLTLTTVGLSDVMGNLQYILSFFDFRKMFGEAGRQLGITGAMNAFKNTLIEYQAVLKVDQLVKIAKAIAILCASMLIISALDTSQLITAVGVIATFMGLLVGAVKALDMVLGNSSIFGNAKKVIQEEVESVGSLGDMWSTAKDKLKSLGDNITKDDIIKTLLPIGETITSSIKDTLTSIKDGFTEIKDSLKQYLKMKALGKIIRSIAIAVAILATALWILAAIPADDLYRGFVALTAIMGLLMIFFYVVSKVSSDFKNLDYKVFVSMGIGILLIAAAFKVFETIDEKSIDKVLVIFFSIISALSVMFAIVGLMQALNTYMQKGKAKDTLSESFKQVGKAVTKIAMAMLVMGVAFKIMATMSWDDVQRSLVLFLSAIGFITLILAALAEVSVMSGKNINFNKIATSILIVTSALVVLAVALKVLATMNLLEMEIAILAVTAALATITLAMYILSKNSDGILRTASSLVIAASALVIMAIPLMMISQLNPTQLAIGLLGMVAVMAALIGLVAMSKLLSPMAAANLAMVALAVMQIGIAVLAISTGILVLVAAVKLFISIGPVFAQALIALIYAVVLAIPTIFAALFTGLDDVWTALFDLVEHIILDLFDLAIELLSVKVPDLIVALGVALVGGLRTWLETQGWYDIFHIIGSGLIELGNYLTEHGEELVYTLCTGLAAAFDGATRGLPILVNSICNFIINAIYEAGEWLYNNTDKVADAIFHLIEGVIYAAATLASRIWTAITDFLYNTIVKPILDFFGIHSPSKMFAEIGENLIKGLAEGIKGMMDFLGGIVDKIIGVINRIKEAAEKVADDVYEALHGPITGEYTGEEKRIDDEAKYLARQAYNSGDTSRLSENEKANYYYNMLKHGSDWETDLYETGVANGEAIVDGTIDGMSGAEEAAAETGEKVSYSYYDTIKQRIPEANQAGKELGEATTSGMDDALNTSQKTWSPYDTIKAHVDESKAAGTEVGNATIDGLLTTVPGMESTGEFSIESYTNGLTTNIPDITSAGSDSTSAYADGATMNITEVENAGEDTSDSLLDGLESNIPNIENMGDLSIDSYVDGMLNNKSSVSSAASEISKSGASAVGKNGSSYSAAGTNSITNLASGMTNNKGAVTTAVSGIAKAGSDKFREFYDTYKDSGKFMLLGFKEGLEDREYIQAVKNAAGDVSYTAANEMRKAGVIASPSKVTMQIGRYFLEGLAIGLSENDIVAESAQGTAKTVLSTLSTAFDKVDELSESINVSPTITPVVDMSHADPGMLSSMLNANRTMTMSGDLQVNDSRSQSALLNALNNLEKNGNRDVVTALNILSGNVAQYTEAVRNMRIVMDSGALVGEIGEAMDYRLGSINNYRQRGMM